MSINLDSKKTKTAMKWLAIAVSIVLLILLVRKLFGITKIKGSKNDYTDPQGQGATGIVTTEVAKLVEETNYEVNRVTVMCFGSSVRCKLWSMWLALGTGDFITGMDIYAKQYGATLRDDLKRVRCSGVCGGMAVSAPAVIERIDRVTNPVF